MKKNKFFSKKVLQSQEKYDIITKLSKDRSRPRPLGQAAKTSPSHGENMGSIPVGVTKKNDKFLSKFVVFLSKTEGLGM